MVAREYQISVDLAATPYSIHVKPGLLADVGSRLANLVPRRLVAIMTDSHVEPLHGHALRGSLEIAGINVAARYIAPAGEQYKTIHTIIQAYDAFLGARIERSTPIVALGGGVVGDMGGFVAATVLRGVPFVQIPTTLLAMVDASVGGKTGVDHAMGKNLIGAFHQPIAVFIDPQVLTTLPARELRSGLAECIKHEIIRDAEGFAALEKNIDKALALDLDYLAHLIAHNVAIKARVVEADPFERGERAHLNLGHTFGHAIESVSQYKYSHGESIALGICAAGFVACKLELITQHQQGRIESLIDRAGLPIGGLTLETADLLAAMASDKKVKAGKVRFILPDGIGKAVIRDDVPPDLVRQAFDYLRR